MTSLEKPRFPAALACEVARELVPLLAPLCPPDRLKVCGSLRRRRPDVGDLEIVFVPRLRVVRAEERDLFGAIVRPEKTEPETAAVLDDLVRRRVLARREKSDGSTTWGRWNRFAVHVATGLPVDFFGCLERAWWNTVVCRTGGQKTNVAICEGAIARGLAWEPSPEAAGFLRRKGLGAEEIVVHSEEEVFAIAGLEYQEPAARA